MRPLPPHDGPSAAAAARAAADAPDAPEATTPVPPAARLPRRRRNQICIAVIALGLANYLVYTLTYAALGGDAHNGRRQAAQRPDGGTDYVYLVRGHHARDLAGRETEVSRAAWIYSYVHSITVPLTSGALIISMLVLARPHILATMRGGLISGEAFVRVFGTLVVLITGATALLFTWHFVAELSRT